MTQPYLVGAVSFASINRVGMSIWRLLHRTQDKASVGGVKTIKGILPGEWHGACRNETHV